MSDFSSSLRGEGGWKQVESPREDYLKKVEDSLDNIFSPFRAISSLDANSLAVYKEASTYKSYLRFTLSPRFHGGTSTKVEVVQRI